MNIDLEWLTRTEALFLTVPDHVVRVSSIQLNLEPGKATVTIPQSSELEITLNGSIATKIAEGSPQEVADKWAARIVDVHLFEILAMAEGVRRAVFRHLTGVETLPEPKGARVFDMLAHENKATDD